MKLVLLLSISTLLGACSSGGRPGFPSDPLELPDLGFLPKKAEKGSLFQYYQAKAGSKWRNNWTSSLDLTGVSWNDSRTATLIAPSYVVMAAHYTRPSDVPVVFHDQKGNPYERFITMVRPLSVGDIAVGKLNLPLPSEVKWYRMARTGDAKIGRPVIVSDQTNTLSVHRIGMVSGGVIGFSYIPELDSIYRRNLVVGDSGHPSFLLENKDLVLLETHTTGGPGAGPFYGDPAVQSAIKAAMAEMGN